jgi:hypothetical protein
MPSMPDRVLHATKARKLGYRLAGHDAITQPLVKQGTKILKKSAPPLSQPRSDLEEAEDQKDPPLCGVPGQLNPQAYFRGVLVMMKLLHALLQSKARKRSLRPGSLRNALRVQPKMEVLERRDMPTVTTAGGALLPHVEAQAMFYGSDWATRAYYGQAIQLSGFLGNIVNSSYMDMLTKAGYGVGRGTASPGDVYGVNVDKTQYLTDAQIQKALLSEIAGGHLQGRDANRLYFVFVEDNVAVMRTNGSTSVKDFMGYHSVIYGTAASLNIHYAVVTYAGGNVPLPSGTSSNIDWGLRSAFDDMTEVASHELAESVTDPDPGQGWADRNVIAEGEIGDLANGQIVYLNGYAVQRIADQNDQAMTPMGATSVNPVNFVLTRDGHVYVSNSSGLTYVLANVASISDQGIDNLGHAMVDFIDIYGSAGEYHEGQLLATTLASNVRQAKAGQGVSYVLLTNGTLKEFKDYGGWSTIDSSVQSIDAGTDQYGVNMVTEVRTDTFRTIYWVNGLPLYYYRQQSDGYERSDSTGLHFIASNLSSMSAGQQGFLDYIGTNGVAYWYSEASAFSSYLGSGVAAVTAGTDQNGNAMIDLLYTSGAVWEWRQGSGWASLATGVVSLGKAHAGIVDTVFTSGNAWAHDAYGWLYLTSNAKTAA